MQLKSVVAGMALILSVLEASTTAANPYINIPEQQRLAHEAQQLWWNSLTPRQQQLVRAIDTEERRFSETTGQPSIPVTQENLIAMMDAIEASEDEAPFVLERMRYRVRLGTTLRGVDNFLACARQHPDWWMHPGLCSAN